MSAAATVEQAREELRSVLRESARSRATHERGEARVGTLSRSEAGRLVLGLCEERDKEEGSLWEHLRRVVGAKRREAAVERVMCFMGRVVGSLSGEESWVSKVLRFVATAAASGEAHVRARACELCVEVLEALGGLDEEDYEALVDVFVQRSCDRTATVRAAACAALERLQDEDREEDRARDALLVATRDANADVRKAAVEALEPRATTLDALIERCRDLETRVRRAAYGVLRRKVHAANVPRWTDVLRGLGDRDDDVKMAAARMTATYFQTLGMDKFVRRFEGRDPKNALAAARACALIARGEEPPPGFEGLLNDDDNMIVVELPRGKPTTPEAAVGARCLAELEIEEGRLSPAALDEALRAIIPAPSEIAEGVGDAPALIDLARIGIEARLVDEAGKRELYERVVLAPSDPSLAVAVARLARACLDDLDVLLDDLVAHDGDDGWKLGLATATAGLVGRSDDDLRVSDRALGDVERAIWLPAVSSADVERREVGVVGLGRRLVVGAAQKWTLGPLLWRVASNALEAPAVRRRAVEALADASMASDDLKEEFWQLIGRIMRDDEDVVVEVAGEAAAKLALRFGSTPDVLCDLACLAFRGTERLRQILALFFPIAAQKLPLAPCAAKLPDLFLSGDEWAREALDDRLGAVLAFVANHEPFAAAYAVCRAILLDDGDDRDARTQLCVALGGLRSPSNDSESALVAALAARCGAKCWHSRPAKRAADKLADLCGRDDDRIDKALDTANLLELWPLPDDNDDNPAGSKTVSPAQSTRGTRSTRARVSYREELDDDKYFADLRRQRKEKAHHDRQQQQQQPS